MKFQSIRPGKVGDIDCEVVMAITGIGRSPLWSYYRRDNRKLMFAECMYEPDETMIDGETYMVTSLQYDPVIRVYAVDGAKVYGTEVRESKDVSITWHKPFDDPRCPTYRVTESRIWIARDGTEFQDSAVPFIVRQNLALFKNNGLLEDLTVFVNAINTYSENHRKLVDEAVIFARLSNSLERIIGRGASAAELGNAIRTLNSHLPEILNSDSLEAYLSLGERAA